MYLNNLVPLNDGWWIEEGAAWFLYNYTGAVLRYNFCDGRCELIAMLPSNVERGFRQYIKCIKSNDDIICLPDFGKFILVYSLEKRQWTEIEVKNDNNRLGCWYYFKKDNILYILSKGLKKIIKLDICGKRILRYYSISSEKDDVFGASVVAANKLFVVSSVYPQIYTFSFLNHEIEIYKLHVEINDNLYAICYQDGNIWLGGKKKRIYRWNISKRELMTYPKVPFNVGIYNFSDKYSKVLNCEAEKYDTFAFIESVQINKYIWFIPFQTNEVLYFDLETNKMNKFEIADEEETEYSLKNRALNHKYLLEYVKDDRYIGLYSLKNEHVIEIDVETLSYRILPFKMENTCFKMFGDYLFADGKKMDKIMFAKKVKCFSQNNSKSEGSVGKQIYVKTLIDE